MSSEGGNGVPPDAGEAQLDDLAEVTDQVVEPTTPRRRRRRVGPRARVVVPGEPVRARIAGLRHALGTDQPLFGGPRRTALRMFVEASDATAGVIAEYQRPRFRRDCQPGGCNEERPCPWVSCKYHLYLDPNPATGALKLNFPDLEPADLRESCALDVAEEGGITLEETGELMNITRERVRQIEERTLRRMRVRTEDPDIE